mmetsp:Transcript_2679/g.7456  ORF Transcript_2679/g.7456 Transcript_2679/m.7456 type:complete len:83 (+) Transcript_2679:299-547(+)
MVGAGRAQLDSTLPRFAPSRCGIVWMRCDTGIKSSTAAKSCGNFPFDSLRLLFVGEHDNILGTMFVNDAVIGPAPSNESCYF